MVQYPPNPILIVKAVPERTLENLLEMRKAKESGLVLGLGFLLVQYPRSTKGAPLGLYRDYSNPKMLSLPTLLLRVSGYFKTHLYHLCRVHWPSQSVYSPDRFKSVPSDLLQNHAQPHGPETLFPKT